MGSEEEASDDCESCCYLTADRPLLAVWLLDEFRLARTTPRLSHSSVLGVGSSPSCSSGQAACNRHPSLDSWLFSSPLSVKRVRPGSFRFGSWVSQIEAGARQKIQDYSDRLSNASNEKGQSEEQIRRGLGRAPNASGERVSQQPASGTKNGAKGYNKEGQDERLEV